MKINDDLTLGEIASACQSLEQLAQVAHALEPKIVPEDKIPHDRQWFSMGMTCVMLQISPPVLRKLMLAAGVRFSHSIDDVPYLDADGFLKAAAYLRDLRAKATKHASN